MGVQRTLSAALCPRPRRSLQGFQLEDCNDDAMRGRNHGRYYHRKLCGWCALITGHGFFAAPSEASRFADLAFPHNIRRRRVVGGLENLAVCRRLSSDLFANTYAKSRRLF